MRRMHRCASLQQGGEGHGQGGAVEAVGAGMGGEGADEGAFAVDVFAVGQVGTGYGQETACLVEIIIIVREGVEVVAVGGEEAALEGLLVGLEGVARGRP